MCTASTRKTTLPQADVRKNEFNKWKNRFPVDFGTWSLVRFLNWCWKRANLENSYQRSVREHTCKARGPSPSFYFNTTVSDIYQSKELSKLYTKAHEGERVKANDERGAGRKLLVYVWGLNEGMGAGRGRPWESFPTTSPPSSIQQVRCFLVQVLFFFLIS